MTREEAKRKLEFFKKAYQKLIDEKVDSGKLVGDGVRGEWKAGTSLDEVYKDAIKALDMAIEAFEQEPKMVLYSGDGYADGCMVYDMAECPNCGYEYEEGDKDWGLPFCPCCGQSLNWESEVQDADSD